MARNAAYYENLQRMAPSIIISGLAMVAIGIFALIFPKSHPVLLVVFIVLAFLGGIFSLGWGALILIRGRRT
jgi:uncharacterized membrane protein HdeD (DUF308 family)